jgi:AraC-like DNA-binding protein
LFFCLAAIVIAAPLIEALLPTLRTWQTAFMLPAFLGMTPMLWLYVKALISEVPWRPTLADLFHFIPALLGVILALLVVLLPAPLPEKMLVQGKIVNQTYPDILMLLAFVLILGLAIQSYFYIVKIVTRLVRFRRTLRNLFASNESRELHWLGWFAVTVGGAWLVLFLVFMMEHFGTRQYSINLRLGSLIGFILIWFLSLWGLRQKPGFHGRYLDSNEKSDFLVTSPSDGKAKYSRSSLEPDKAERIAMKIHKVMKEDKLYLDPDLSLPKLSRAISVSLNLVSQTLNQSHGESFFDYVNRWRIAAAKERVLNTNETITEIAYDVGFNARSSFYKAFKRATGLTPKEFRKNHTE